MNHYIELLEQIVGEMNQVPMNREISESDIDVWRGFLKQVKPDSRIFNLPFPRGPNRQSYSDVRDIMMLAEINKFPVWHIRLNPKTEISLEYIHGKLRAETKVVLGVPKELSGFSGYVWGAIQNNSPTTNTFVAYDVSGDMTIADKIEFLKTSNFALVESILFPTERIQTISSSKLETFFRNYVRSMEEKGFEVDGATIFSDVAISTSNGKEIGRRITFIPT